MGFHSNGMRVFTQSRNAWVYTVEEPVGLHSRETPWFTLSRNAKVYTVEERLG